MDSNQDIRPDAKLKNLPADALEEMWQMRHPLEGGKKLSFRKIQAEVPLRYGFTVSLSVLVEFYGWLALRWRILKAEAASQQAREELARDPESTEDDLRRIASKVFLAETMGGMDVKGYVAVEKVLIAREKLGLDARRIALLEEAAKQRDAAKEVLGSNLSQEEQNRRIREILK